MYTRARASRSGLISAAMFEAQLAPEARSLEPGELHDLRNSHLVPDSCPARIPPSLDTRIRAAVSASTAM